jgi:hypothetical protein
MSNFTDEYVDDHNYREYFSSRENKKEDIKEPEDEAQEWIEDISGAIDYLIPFDCPARRIQDWILERSIKKQPALAMLAAYSVMGVIMGRAYNIDGIKGNTMFIGLLGSGQGKDWPQKAARLLLTELNLSEAISDQLASGAALFELIEECPSCFVNIDEVGHYFKNTNSGGNQYSREIMPMMTRLATDAAAVFQDKARQGKRGGTVSEPNLCFFGLSTEAQILEAMTTSEIADGSLARYFVAFGNNEERRNKELISDRKIPFRLTMELNNIKTDATQAWALNGHSLWVDLPPDYLEAKNSMFDYFDNKAIEIGRLNSEKSKFKPFYARLLVRAMQLAYLTDKCASIDVFKWACKLVEEANEVMIKKFLLVSADNETEKGFKAINTAIKKAGKKGITSTDLFNQTRGMLKPARDGYIKDLIDNDLIFTAQHTKPGAKKKTTVYYWRK